MPSCRAYKVTRLSCQPGAWLSKLRRSCGGTELLYPPKQYQYVAFNKGGKQYHSGLLNPCSLDCMHTALLEHSALKYLYSVFLYSAIQLDSQVRTG